MTGDFIPMIDEILKNAINAANRMLSMGYEFILTKDLITYKCEYFSDSGRGQMICLTPAGWLVIESWDILTPLRPGSTIQEVEWPETLEGD